jgi:hypothetical protein
MSLGDEMKLRDDIEVLEKLIGQLQGLHSEMAALAKKSPNDAVNGFKLGLINRVLKTGNEVLGKKYRPFDDFDSLDADDVPSTSDVAMILAQYMEEAERYRSDNVTRYGGRWVYVVNGQPSEIPSGPPRKIGK